MKKIILSFVCIFYLNGFAQIPTAIRGNWINEKTNDWEYGFFDEFTIYNCDFWDCNLLEEKKNKYKLRLQNEDQLIELELTLKNDSILQIQNGKKKESYHLMRTTYPYYPKKDMQAFSEPTSRKDSATLIGYYYNFQNTPQDFRGESIFNVSVPDFILDEEVRFFTEIDSLGRFSITFPIMDTQQVFGDWQQNRLTKMLIVEPGDTLFLFANMLDLMPQENDGSWEGYKNRDKEILFMGKNARINNELAQYKFPSLSTDRYKDVAEGIRGMAFLEKAKGVYEQRMQFLNTYTQAHPTLSDKFTLFCTEYEKYLLASDLMQHRFDLRRNDGERFEEAYIEFVEENFPLDKPIVYHLIRNFHGFLVDYIGYLGESESLSYTITPGMIAEEMKRKNIGDEAILQDLKQAEIAIEQLQNETDSVKMMEMLSELQPMMNKINENAEALSVMQEMFSNFFFMKGFESSDSILALYPVLKELWDASIIYKTFENSRLPLSDKQMLQFEERIHNPDIRSIILNINNYYAALANKSFISEESFKNTDHLADITDMDDLLRQLTEPYKGNVIYLDFWGTWCRPCRDNMKLAGAIEKEIHDENVIFMYLANNSPEASWKSIVREMDLTGDKIVHYRLPDSTQDRLEKYLGVNSFPTYMLIDKNGKLHNRNAPSPRDKASLLQEIRHLLQETK